MDSSRRASTVTRRSFRFGTTSLWHNISKSEVVAFSPSLADKIARNTATHTVDEIADEIASVIRPS